MTLPPERFDYFMLRLSRSEQEPGPITGLAELLRTGEKRRFETGEQLLHLIDEWSARPLRHDGNSLSPLEESMKPTEPGTSDKAKDLDPKAIKPETADQVRGGRARKGGDDDDLEELQVQR
jgi:hypothetical protein